MIVMEMELPRELDCNDEDATIGGDCDGDGLVTAEDCDDSDPLLGGDFDDCDGDGILFDIDCDDSDVSIDNTNGLSGKTEDCSGTDCLSILEMGYSVGNGYYWIAPYDLEPFEVYCDMETEGGGWMLFGDLTSYKDHWGGSYRVGSVDRGDLRDLDNGYSLQLSELHEESDEYFDIMIQYGQDNTYDIVREGYQKNGTSFWYGENLGVNKVNGYYLSHCSDAYCNNGGQDS